MVAPNGMVYVLFTATSPLSPIDYSCVLAQVYVATGEVVCIENQMSPVWEGTGDEAVQFDEAGNIYYMALDLTGPPGPAKLRRYSNGVSSDYTNPYQNVSRWLVMKNGDLVVAGATNGTNRTWTRRISATGKVSTIANVAADWIRYFPDGDVYMGITSSGADAVHDSYAKKIWSVTGEVTDYDIGGIVSLAGAPSANARWITTSTGEVFLFDNNTLRRAFPRVDSNVASVTNAVSTSVSSDDLILAGTSKSGANRLVRLNLVSRTESVLIDETNEIEVYNVRWSKAQGRVFFDGLRFSDNKYVIGSIDVSTKQVTARESTVKIGQFETFAG
jgi:hypothetical protein